MVRRQRRRSTLHTCVFGVRLFGYVVFNFDSFVFFLFRLLHYLRFRCACYDIVECRVPRGQHLTIFFSSFLHFLVDWANEWENDKREVNNNIDLIRSHPARHTWTHTAHSCVFFSLHVFIEYSPLLKHSLHLFLDSLVALYAVWLSLLCIQ